MDINPFGLCLDSSSSFAKAVPEKDALILLSVSKLIFWGWWWRLPLPLYSFCLSLSGCVCSSSQQPFSRRWAELCSCPYNPPHTHTDTHHHTHTHPFPNHHLTVSSALLVSLSLDESLRDAYPFVCSSDQWSAHRSTVALTTFDK